MTDTPQICEAGDSAVLLRLARVIDPDVNARAIAIANVVRDRALAGVRDVVSTFHSVAVYFDPLHGDADAIAGALQEGLGAPFTTVTGRRHEISVLYGGADGPDLDEVGRLSGLTPAEVIKRHAEQEYRVFMLGFQPGFAYMGLVDPRIASPRRAIPRLNVARGSVGIAGRQTGVYPAASPGGWQIVGRTLTSVFDPLKSPPALFAPGDSVTFKPAVVKSTSVAASVSAATRTPDASRGVFSVIRPGLFTTVQDSGRWGRQGLGVPVGGAMDALSHAVANAAVGNPRGTPALEATIAGPELRVERATTIAVAGADLSATIDGRPVRLQQPVTCAPGALLRFGRCERGARAYVAVEGGVQLTPGWFGPLVANQRVGAGTAVEGRGRLMKPLLPIPSGGAQLRVLPGPQRDQLPAACFDALCSRRFTVSTQSNRVGYRLDGAVVPSAAGDMISDATFAGAIQIPPSGEPILLMADRQTTGGYPQVAVVIAADLALAGQLAPGDWVEFVPCTRGEARVALARQEALFANGE